MSPANNRRSTPSKRSVPRWITLPGLPSHPNQWICLRRSFSCARDAAAVARIACDSKYWLWINGTLVVREGGLKRGSAGVTWEDEISVGAHLRDGENTIAILLWFFGRSGLSHHTSPFPVLHLSVGAVRPLVVSDGAWKVAVHPAYYSPDDSQTNFRIPEPQVGFDASRDIPDWQQPSYDDSGWECAEPLSPAHAARIGRFMPRPIPLFRYGAHQEYVSVSREGTRTVAVLPKTAHVHPYFEIDASTGLRISVMTDRYALGGLRHHASMKLEYVTRQGEQEFESPAWMSGDRVIYELPPGVTVKTLGFRESCFDTDVAGAFSCTDPELGILSAKALRTLQVCMRDSFMDCPDRERGMYAGDTANALMQALHAFDARGVAVCRQAILDFLHSQRADGSLYAPVGGAFYEELPHQSLALCGALGIWSYYRYTGDRDLLAQAYPVIKRYLSLWKIGKDGFVEKRRGDWYWCDWGNNIDSDLLDNTWYLLALQGLGNAARVLGHKADAAWCARRIASISKAVNDAWCADGVYRSSAHTGEPDDRGNALAVLSGVAAPQQYPAVAALLGRVRNASTYMERFVLEALFRMGEHESALVRMKERYAPMIASAQPTLWENFDTGMQENPTASFNHAWSGAPLHLLPQYVAGITPLEPAFKKYAIAPRFVSGMSSIRCRVPAPGGVISLIATFEAWQYFIELSSPQGTTALVHIPRKYYHSKLKVNGHPVMVAVDVPVWPLDAAAG